MGPVAMTDLVQGGLGFVLWLQSFSSPALDALFQLVNQLQTEEFFLVALVFIYWCLDKRQGVTFALFFLSIDYVARLLKGITAVARPYQMDPHVRNLDPQVDSSFPSAGTLDSTTFWGYWAVRLRRPAFWTLAGGIIATIALARMYLGAHYPGDVAGGFLIGAGVLALVLGLNMPRRIAALPRPTQAVLAVAWPVVLALAFLREETAPSLGALLGIATGYLAEETWVRFETRAPWWRQALKFILGLAVALALRFGLKAVLPPDVVWSMVRYAIMGFWMGAGAPWLYVAVGLAGRTPPTSVARGPEGKTRV